MAEEKHNDSGFKVVDRRAFSVDGTRRQGPREEESKGETPPGAPHPRAPRREPEPEEAVEPGPAGFDTLVSYLSTTALFQMGLLPGPGGERIPTDLVNAQQTIDLLEVLQQKTRGNLTPDEGKLLEDVLYELRLSYVEVNKRLAKKAK